MLRVIGAPVDSSEATWSPASPSGCALAPSTLRGLGVIAALDAVDAGDLNDGDRAGRPAGLADGATLDEAVRHAVITSLHAGDLPVVIGGCRSVLPGAIAGARDALGVVSLAVVGGGLRLDDRRTSPTGHAADMSTAIVLGHGDDEWLDRLGAPLVSVEGIAILGARDRAQARSRGSVLPEELGASSEFDPDTLRDLGLERAGRDTERSLTGTAEGFWLHLDIDVLASDKGTAPHALPPGGLEWDELAILLSPLTSSEALVGFSLTGYAPARDSADFAVGEALVSLLSGLLRE